jgi:hypothetical protein
MTCPERYHANINRDPPLADQRPGATEIDDVIAFMQTLTDGYLHANPYRAARATTRTAPLSTPKH